MYPKLWAAVWLLLLLALAACEDTVATANDTEASTGTEGPKGDEGSKGTGTGGAAAGPIIVGYYETWKNTAEDVDPKVFGDYTYINIAFGIPQADGSIQFPDGEDWMPDTISQMHEAGANVLVSLGGWTGSQYLSGIVADEAASETFITNIVTMMKDKELDGIDIDWEYPGKEGAKCNTFDAAADSENFLKFLQALRTAIDAEYPGEQAKIITAAVGVEPWYSNGQPMTDLSEYAEVVDFVHLMAYDIMGGFSETTGPNAPLLPDPNGSAISFSTAIDAWTGAKWPPEKMTAGLAFYGHSMTITGGSAEAPESQYQPKESTLPQGDQDDATYAEPCDGTDGYSGQWQWKNLRAQEVLTSPAEAAEPWIRTFDETTMTPWLYNGETKMYISYDDPESIQAKLDCAKEKGIAGVMVWAMSNDNGELIDVLTQWQGGGSAGGGGGNSTGDPKGDDDTTGDPKSDDDTTGDPKGDDDTTGDPKSDDDTTDDTKDGNTTGDGAAAGSGGGAAAGTGGGECSTEGEMSCDDSGSAPEYTLCLFGSNISLACPGDTVCITNESSIICGWPETEDTTSSGDGGSNDSGGGPADPENSIEDPIEDNSEEGV